MRCAICGEQAEEVNEASVDVFGLRCGLCGSYDISKASIEALGRLEQSARLQALRYAQTNALPGRRPHLHGIG